MSDLKICRVCLETDGKMFNYDQFQLKSFYQQILSIKARSKDSLPPYFCYECAAMLYKFHKFKEKCSNGQKTLKELMAKGSITKQSVQKIDRGSKNLLSTLGIITVTNRVRTYLVRHELRPKKLKPDPVQINVSDTSNHVVSDDSVDYKIDIKDEFESLRNNVNINDGQIKNNIEREKTDTEQTVDIENVFADDTLDETAPSDDEDGKLFVDDQPDQTEIQTIPVRKKKKVKGNKKKKIKVKEKHSKIKRFEATDKKKTELDPNNWLKFNLSEEEAVAEFKSRGEHRRYLSAEFKCVDCLKGFSKEDMLNRHIKLRHSESVGPIECRFCRMRFKWKCYLTKHMRQHYTKYKCLRCDLVCPLETTALFHEEYHNGVIRKCAHCGEEFKHLTTYYTHLRTHRSEHVCPLCGASFVSATGLRIHKKIKHLNESPEVPQGQEEYCDRCDIRFDSRKAFEEHLVHSAMHVDGIEDLEVKDFKPSNPKKRRLKVKRMTRIPTDCHLCGKHFSTQAACRKHHLAEHPRTSFFAPNERHICEICGISLAPGSVSSHLNTHTREKMYSCNICGRQFSSKGGMTTHQLTHTSEKPVPCTLCDKRFKQISSMKLHYRTFHLKEPYPKRNRKKKGDELSKLDDYGPEESDDNMTLDRWR